MKEAADPVGDYGIDSPVVLLVLGITAAGALLVTVVSGILDHVAVMAGAFVVAAVVTGAGLVLVRSSRVHKVRERVRLVDRLVLDGSERVLDVGCGRGLLLVEVARRLDERGRAIGVDAWPALDGVVVDAEHARRNARFEAVDHQLDLASADVGSLPFPEGVFDAVVSGLALHHIAGFESRVHAIREVSRVIAPGGRVVLIDRHHTGQYVDALRGSDFVDVVRSRRVWRLIPPARYVTGTKAAPVPRRFAASADPPAESTPAESTPAEDTPAEEAEVVPSPTPDIEPVPDEAAARAVAEEFLDEVLAPEHPDVELVVTEVLELPSCWVAGWNTRTWVETNADDDAVANAGPIIVSKRSGFARLGVAALPVEDQLDGDGDGDADGDDVTGERDGAGHDDQDQSPDGPSM